jgi:hypothetical protein
VYGYGEEGITDLEADKIGAEHAIEDLLAT